ncbi:hypothetical protein A5671_07710 [Mycolicibacter heraklionensis]|nr:hypothetical protein A5671_07710 [Mycolicibacter heraklionensis]
MPKNPTSKQAGRVFCIQEAALLAMADIERFTASEAAEEYGISIAAICNWVRRGHLRPTGIDHRGCKTYRKADLEQVRSR